MWEMRRAAPPPPHTYLGFGQNGASMWFSEYFVAEYHKLWGKKHSESKTPNFSKSEYFPIFALASDILRTMSFQELYDPVPNPPPVLKLVNSPPSLFAPLLIGMSP